MNPKKKTATKKPRKTSPQEEMTRLGVIINLMLQMDAEARERVTNYLNDRFGGYL